MFKDLNRSLEILEKTLAGRTMAEVGREYGLSRSRVSSIINTTIRMMMRPAYLHGIEFPDHDFWKPNERIKQASFWRQHILRIRSAHSGQ